MSQALWRCSLNVIVFLVGHIMFPHCYDHMSQWSQISKIALWRCSLNVILIVIVILIVFVFLFIRSCLLITLIKCLKGHCPGELSDNQWLVLCNISYVPKSKVLIHSVSEWQSHLLSLSCHTLVETAKKLGKLNIFKVSNYQMEEIGRKWGWLWRSF